MFKLSGEDKANVKAVWDHVKGHEDAFGHEALGRMFTGIEQTHTYFPDKDLNEGSFALHSHGKKVMGALSNAVAHIDDLEATLVKLSDKHAHDLMVDPAEFPRLAEDILVVLGFHLPAKFTYAVQCSIDKFLHVTMRLCISKYR
uniref:Hemoglobin subunit alpha n=1 Tax=Ambystoma mexicanum TaxID=8296 RepID=HBA_AMBME|nr:RecName: Full=Hemoglobin subunit alpha; AltName: Full=Alpha-globin; AltName: Full=Hemoglobin alpha chain [Ambystoma mexicanum]